MYYVYVLRSLKNRNFHKGLTNDLERRIREHDAGKTSSNKSLLPFELVHVELFESLEEARKMEKFFKSGYGREIIKEIAGVVER